MSSPSRDLRLAGPRDGGDILDLLEGTPSRANISLYYTRRPDPWASYQRDGDDVMLAVYRNPRSGGIDGMGACAINHLYIEGKPAKVAYLYGFRLREEALSRVVLLPRGYRWFLDIMAEKGVSCSYTTVLEGNLPARRMLEKRRASMPVYEYAGNFEIFALATGGKAKLPAGYRFRAVVPGDGTRLLEFLNREGGRHPFFPVLTEGELSRGTTTPRLQDFCILEDPSGEIVCAGAIWDQREYKQYIVRGYGGAYRLLYPLSPLVRLLGYPRLSPPGTVLPFFTLSCFASKEDSPALFGLFLRGIRSAGRGFDYLLVGLHGEHPFRRVVARRPHIVYRSRLYLVYEGGRGRPIMTPGDIPYLECGRL